MPFGSYDELQTAVGRWLKRTNLNDSIPDFIALAEAKLNTKIRVRQMRTFFSITPTQPFVSLPGDYAEAIRLTYGTRRMDFISENLATEQMNRDGQTDEFTIAGNKIWLLTYVDGQTKMTLHYYQNIESLSESNTSNWLLEDAPNIYLYAALVEAEPFIKNDDRIAIWAQMLQAALDDLERNDDSGQHSGSALSMRAG
jgi:hypothetical protein